MVCASIAFIDGLGAPEMVLIFVVVLVLFGGQKLPEFARGLGKSIREFKKAAAGVEEEFKRALEEDERKHTTPALPAASSTSTATPGTSAAVAEGGPDASTHPVTYDEVTGEPIYADDTPAATPETPAAPTEQKILPPAVATEQAAPVAAPVTPGSPPSGASAPSNVSAPPPAEPAPASARPATPS